MFEEVRVVDGIFSAENCFALSANANFAYVKPRFANFLQEIDISTKSTTGDYVIEQKFSRKRWIYMEEVSVEKLAVLMESKKTWHIATFVIDRENSKLELLRRSMLNRKTHCRPSRSVSIHKDKENVCFMAIQDSTIGDKKHVSLLKCSISEKGVIKNCSSQTVDFAESAHSSAQVFLTSNRLHLIDDSKKLVRYLQEKCSPPEWKKQYLGADTANGYPSGVDGQAVRWKDKLWLYDKERSVLWSLDLCSFQWRQVEIPQDRSQTEHNPKTDISLRIAEKGLVCLIGRCSAPSCLQRSHLFTFDLNNFHKRSR